MVKLGELACQTSLSILTASSNELDSAVYAVCSLKLTWLFKLPKPM